MDTPHSQALFERAQRVIPGGVNSPVRAFRAVGRQPLFIESARGATISDADGNSFIDYIGSWGPMILGHAYPAVIAAVREAATRGSSFGAPTELEIDMAEALCEAYPSIEKVRLVSSGTEATMSAIRLARGFTGRDKIVKFEGCYHGHSDSLLVKAGSGLATFSTPDSAGVPLDFTRNTIIAPFNDADELRRIFAAQGKEIAGVIIEPIAGNMGCVPPVEGYLQALRQITEAYGALLIFDEVMTGFRVAYGGAQALYGITPDITCLGKIIGGGLPAAAFGGSATVMNCVAPLGAVYQAGTLSGNPIAVTAGLTTLKLLQELNPYEQLEHAGQRLENGLREAANEAGVVATINRVGSMLTAFFTTATVVDWNTAKTADTSLYGRFFRAMLDEGIYLAPSQFECAFISIAHSEELLDRTLAAARKAMRQIA
ncbi:MAG: glutamate-1-semialdehyde 2,1-aminomutase [Acidobacteria bacterium]|nr:glutamate-1-semialdehyde 2,1-aminomutase [Acidobacteriota bacterium]